MTEPTHTASGAGSRSFRVGTDDERIPTLLGVLSAIIALQRYNRIWPKRIRLNADVYLAVSAYFGSTTTDKLFNVPVEANLDKDALPFIIEADTWR